MKKKKEKILLTFTTPEDKTHDFVDLSTIVTEPVSLIYHAGNFFSHCFEYSIIFFYLATDFWVKTSSFYSYLDRPSCPFPRKKATTSHPVSEESSTDEEATLELR